MSSALYYCETCGSPHVQINEWRDANTGQWRVYWIDPDNGDCSKELDPFSLEMRGDVVHGIDANGCDLECYAHELLWVARADGAL